MAKGGVLYLKEEDQKVITAKAVTGISINGEFPMKNGFQLGFGVGMAGNLMILNDP